MSRLDTCLCGHNQRNHKQIPYFPSSICICIVNVCDCAKFVLDNFKYIERVHEAKAQSKTS